MPRRNHIRCIFLLVLFFGSIAAVQTAIAAAPPERDIWYSISDGEQRYGSMHIVVRRLEDGTFEYAVSSHLKVELLGARQEVVTSATALVTPDLTPLRMESDVEQMSGRLRVRGHATDEGFVIEREQDGQTHRSTFLFDDEIGSVFNLTLSDWLHRLALEMDEAPEPADASITRRVRVLAAESGEPTEVIVRLIRRGADGSTAWAMESDQDWKMGTFRLDADGVMVEQILTVPPMRIERTPRDEAMGFDYRTIPDRELLVFPFDRQLPPTRRVQRIDVRLTWKNIPTSEFELEDARQRIESIEEEDGLYTAIVSLGRMGEVRLEATRPLSAERFESTLAGTDLIQPNDERIAAIVREIVGEEASALAAVTTICQWVSDYIEPAMIAETLSGPQVLERRTGKCTEYTTLFASLARAAGIPTRIALGQRRFSGAGGDSWGGHMWNEAFVGEWIPVDASVNEVGGSLDLLKFIHSDTVMGTQSLRWKLTESLEVSIADVELVPDTGGAAVNAGLHEGTYTNVDYGFRFDLPDDTWTIDENSSPGALLLRFRQPDAALGDSAMLHLTAFSAPAGIPAKMLTDARLNHHRTGLNDFEVLLDEAIEVRGAKGHRVRFRGAPQSENAVPLHVTEVLIIVGESGLLLNLISTEELHELQLAPFESILSTVSFID